VIRRTGLVAWEICLDSITRWKGVCGSSILAMDLALHPNLLYHLDGRLEEVLVQVTD
jgi:hypothetical protein